MLGLCGLDPELNKCEYYIRDKGSCGADGKSCCFWEPLELDKKPDEVREPKWFEKYYKK